MKFYLDENFPPDLVVPLRSIYGEHDFSSWTDEALSGVLDSELFDTLSRRGFDSIITRDRAQLKDESERAALVDAGLRWVGLRSTKLAGLGMLSITAASLIAGLRFVIEHDAVIVEHSYLIWTVPHGASQRVRINPLVR